MSSDTMALNGRPLKRMKRRVTADQYDFLTFPAAGEDISAAGSLDEPFRSSVRLFLSRHALEIQSLVPHLLTWQIEFRIGEMDGRDSSPETRAILHVVEEDVARSSSVYCNQCRVVGEFPPDSICYSPSRLSRRMTRIPTLDSLHNHRKKTVPSATRDPPLGWLAQ